MENDPSSLNMARRSPPSRKLYRQQGLPELIAVLSRALGEAKAGRGAADTKGRNVSEREESGSRIFAGQKNEDLVKGAKTICAFLYGTGCGICAS